MKFTHQRSFYIPTGAKKIELEGINAVAYHVATTNAQGLARHHVVAFGGRRNKPDINVVYRTQDAAEMAIAKHFHAEARRASEKASRRASANQPHNLKVGSVLTGSWGYEQTNVDAFQVVEVVGKSTVRIRKIGLIALDNASGHDSDYVVPDVDGFTSDEVLTRRATSDGRVRGQHDSCRLSPWTGGKLYRSWYH